MAATTTEADDASQVEAKPVLTAARLYARSDADFGVAPTIGQRQASSTGGVSDGG